MIASSRCKVRRLHFSQRTRTHSLEGTKTAAAMTKLRNVPTPAIGEVRLRGQIFINIFFSTNGLHTHRKTVVISDVESINTVREVKARIEKEKGISVGEQGLVHVGNMLVDPSELADYRILQESTIELRLHLRGVVKAVANRGIEATQNCGDRQTLCLLCPDERGRKKSLKHLANKTIVIREYDLENKNVELLSHMRIAQGEIAAVFEKTVTIWHRKMSMNLQSS